MAALTMPSLIQNHRNTVIINSLKKSYSELTQAVSLLENDYNGNFYDITSGKSTEEIKSILIKYYAGAIECDIAKCFTDKNLYKSYDGTDINTRGQEIENYYFGKNASAFLTKDGRLVSTGGSPEYSYYITIDTNGPFKKPNTWGGDSFSFRIAQDGIKICGGSTYCVDTNLCSKNRTNVYNGITCTYKAFTEKDFLNQ